MPNDAKFGLVVGVGLVIAVAVVFFEKVDSAASGAAQPATASVSNDPPADVKGEQKPGEQPNPVTAQAPGTPTPAASGPHPSPSNVPGQLTGRNATHVVESGDTLFSLAERYYGDGERFIDIYRANRHILYGPDRLPIGAELRIP